MRLRSVSLNRSLPLAAALAIALAACGDTVVPALDEAERRLESEDGSEEGGADGGADLGNSCFDTVLYKLKGDQLVRQGAGRVINPEDARTDPCPAFVVSNGAASVDVCLSLNGGDGYARMRWNGAVVGEVTISKSFFMGDQTTVLSHDAGDAGYFEFRLSYHAACDLALVPS